MSTKRDLERLVAADPALAVTEGELAKSRERSLAVILSDAEQLTVGGSVEDFHRQSSSRRFRLVVGVGLVAATAAVIAGVAVSGVFVAAAEQPAPAVTHTVATEETGSPLPEITGRMPTFDNHIVTGGSGNKAAVANDPEADFHMDAANPGKLGINAAGCFVSIYPDGSEGSLIFPSGTRIVDSGVVFPDGATLTIGDDFVFGGGSAEVDEGQCAPRGSAFLVQSWDSTR